MSGKRVGEQYLYGFTEPTDCNQETVAAERVFEILQTAYDAVLQEYVLHVARNKGRVSPVFHDALTNTRRVADAALRTVGEQRRLEGTSHDFV